MGILSLIFILLITIAAFAIHWALGFAALVYFMIQLFGALKGNHSKW
jgi:hypothetical protein